MVVSVCGGGVFSLALFFLQSCILFALLRNLREACAPAKTPAPTHLCRSTCPFSRLWESTRGRAGVKVGGVTGVFVTPPQLNLGWAQLSLLLFNLGVCLLLSCCLSSSLFQERKERKEERKKKGKEKIQEENKKGKTNLENKDFFCLLCVSNTSFTKNWAITLENKVFFAPFVLGQQQPQQQQKQQQ